MSRATLLTVRRPDQSEVFEFRGDQQRMTFGRGDQGDIVIPSPSNDLSRLAGMIWRAQGELWIRNLSFANELTVDVPGVPGGEPMRPRRDDRRDPGFARAVG